MATVSKELAELLKHNGYDEPCKKLYQYKTRALKGYDLTQGVVKNHNASGACFVSAPEMHEVADWLRGVKGLHVSVMWRRNYGKFVWELQNITIGFVEWEQVYFGEQFDTHNAALEAGIVYALKNLCK